MWAVIFLSESIRFLLFFTISSQHKLREIYRYLKRYTNFFFFEIFNRHTAGLVNPINTYTPLLFCWKTFRYSKCSFNLRSTFVQRFIDRTNVKPKKKTTFVTHISFGRLLKYCYYRLASENMMMTHCRRPPVDTYAGFRNNFKSLWKKKKIKKKKYTLSSETNPPTTMGSIICYLRGNEIRCNDFTLASSRRWKSNCAAVSSRTI